MKLLTIAISISIFIGCNYKREQEYQKEGNSIIAACIKKMIGTGDTAKMGFNMSPDDFPDDFPPAYKEQAKRQRDSTKKRMLSINPFIVVMDPVSFLKKGLKEVKYGYDDSMVYIMNKNGYQKLEYKAVLTVADTNYLVQQLGLMVTNKEPWKKGKELYFHDDRFIAIFDFESIKYNAERQVAIVDGSAWCGGTCGFGYYMLLEKRGAVWEVIYFTKTSES